MNPTVVAAIIAAAVSGLTLVGTLAAQLLSRRATSRDTQQALDRTLAEQREQLDRTLAEQRTRTANERFATAADRLGSDKPAAVRLAGVYAMAGLADDWEANRQTCVDVLCGYLRMPYDPDPGKDSPIPEQLAFQASREVRHTVIRVIAAHLKDDATVSWQGLDFDFRGAVFDGGDFSNAQFSGGTVDFGHSQFSGGEVSFSNARFSGGTVYFRDTSFCGESVDFSGAEFSGGRVSFSRGRFSGGEVYFGGAKFGGGKVHFGDTEFVGAAVSFGASQFSDSAVSFSEAKFSRGAVYFNAARFSGGEVYFGGAEFCGGEVNFGGAEFVGGVVDFSQVDDWSSPPKFPWTDTPPAGVQLPASGTD
jgi:uncharacterized protein YjbI with pentapeptide repeats